MNLLFLSSQTCLVLVRANDPLGQVVLVRLRLEAQIGFPNVDWHCNRVEIRQCTKDQEPEPESSESQVFCCDKWLRTADGDVELRSGKCEIVFGPSETIDQLSGTPGSRRSGTVQVSVWPGPLRFSELNLGTFCCAHWKEDWYFGYQCLSGCNPLLLHQTRLIPPNLAVTSDMLRPFLPAGSSLEEELQKGNIYLLDYKLLDGLEANQINGKQTYLSAPLCLLHLNQQGQMVPIAIQQSPGPQNPVFLPSDSDCDWLLAKIWVHSADFQGHQLISHYMRTHMMAELCCVATLRQFPEHHPLHQNCRIFRFFCFQLLMPHVRTSLQINLQARASLLAVNGVFDQGRGNVTSYYVFLYGESCFHTKAEVSKFLTMFIYSCSALHAAVNFSQLDFALWMPNCPPSMMRPPPQVKGGVTEQDILSFLPGINSTLRVLMALTVLEAIFRVDAHRRLVEGVQAELKAINDDITERNRHLELPYPYLCPSGIENSVAI
ncbi:hypothetical protein GOODEAATRI_013555 [Goodea atripinnis]|uniref:Lipoxygenase domain-containing protein n=1 Tax=Goodea atripinnis TaxID=208336 RepID=A0ABV0PNZ3_9TELE